MLLNVCNFAVMFSLCLLFKSQQAPGPKQPSYTSTINGSVRSHAVVSTRCRNGQIVPGFLSIWTHKFFMKCPL